MEGIWGEMTSLKGISPVSSCAVIAPTAHTSDAGSNLPLHASGDKNLRSSLSYFLSGQIATAFPPQSKTA